MLLRFPLAGELSFADGRQNHLELAAYPASRAEALEDMIAEGVLDEAREYAVRIIKQFMLALGFEEVKIK